jgi:GNAT superfamily N-acetyltransferase
MLSEPPAGGSFSLEGAMEYELKVVTTPADWRTMHDIRREVLFTAERHPGLVYDENHPDDHQPNHTPYLLLRHGKPIGVVRLDDRGEEGIVRLVAIVTAEQGRGHGRALDALICDEARRRGIKQLALNAAPEAVGFYEKTGWARTVWDAGELAGMARDCVQMVKGVGP